MDIEILDIKEICEFRGDPKSLPQRALTELISWSEIDNESYNKLCDMIKSVDAVTYELIINIDNILMSTGKFEKVITEENGECDIYGWLWSGVTKSELLFYLDTKHFIQCIEASKRFKSYVAKTEVTFFCKAGIVAYSNTLLELAKQINEKAAENNKSCPDALLFEQIYEFHNQLVNCEVMLAGNYIKLFINLRDRAVYALNYMNSEHKPDKNDVLNRRPCLLNIIKCTIDRDSKYLEYSVRRANKLNESI